MIEFREYANQLKEKYHIESPSFYEDFVRFLVDNEWFQIQPKWLNEQLMIEYNDFKKLQEIIEKHFTLKEMSTFDKCLELWNMLNNSFPDTASKLADFYAINSFPKEIEYYITSFLLKFIQKCKCQHRNAIKFRNKNVVFFRCNYLSSGSTKS